MTLDELKQRRDNLMAGKAQQESNVKIAQHNAAKYEGAVEFANALILEEEKKAAEPTPEVQP